MALSPLDAARDALAEALDAAGKVLKERFGKVHARLKGRANLVTEADLASQKAVLSVIKRRCPGHDWRCEEDDVRDTGAEFVWVVDPLDGTTNYAHGYPASAVSVGVLRRGVPTLGGVHDPFRDERFTAERGKGARLNGKILKVSSPKKLDESLLVTGFAYDRGDQARSKFYVELYRRFMTASHDVRRSGAASLDMAWIAAGRADGFWERGLSPWDVAAGRLLVEEAGGRVSDFSGAEWVDLKEYGRETLATNGRIHDAMLKMIQDHAKDSK